MAIRKRAQKPTCTKPRVCHPESCRYRVLCCDGVPSWADV
uniref:Uncharacterized protein n=1 Tax=Anguilla anguilla TaxID=7936 RepID=A0A0E9VFX7_ANGAN